MEEVEQQKFDGWLKAKLRRHAFTYFNYTVEDVERLKNLNAEQCDYIVCGFEVCPETNNKHLQGYIEFGGVTSGSTCIKILQGVKTTGKIIKPCTIRGSGAVKSREPNITYCKKAESKDPAHAEEPWFEVVHRAKKQGSRFDLLVDALKDNATYGTALETDAEITIKHNGGVDKVIKYLENENTAAVMKERFQTWIPYKWQQSLIEELSTPCRNDRKIIWYVDPIGNRGKTKVCDYLHFMLDAELLENGKTSDLAAAWLQKGICLFDLSRSTQEVTNYGAIESIKNKRMFSPKYNSCTKWATQDIHVVIFANWEPDLSKLSEDRWDIRRLTDEDCEPAPIYEMLVIEDVDNID